jgi:hypothetical protein
VVTANEDSGFTANDGAVTISDIDTSNLEVVPQNASEDDWYVFGSGSSANVNDGVYTDADGTEHSYFGYDTETFTLDATHLIFPKTGDNTFVFTPEKDSKLVIKVNEGLSFAPSVYSTTDMTAAEGDVTNVSSTGTYTYYVKGGTTYTISGLSGKTTRIQKLQLLPIEQVTNLNVVVDYNNKTEKDVVVSVYDGTTYLGKFTATASTNTTYALTKTYVAGKSYTFKTSDNSVKIESYEFSIPADATDTYTAKLTLTDVKGLKIYLRNAPESGFKMTFNGTTDTYTSETPFYTYDAVAGQSYVFSTANDSNITKWPNESVFTYDKSAKKFYIHVPDDYDGDYTLYFDYATNTLHTLYEKDNSTSVANAKVGYYQYGFGEVKTTVTGNDARKTLTYAGVTPSLTDFKGSYEYAVRDTLNLGYDYSTEDGSGKTRGYRDTVNTETSQVLNDNRLLINADTASYVQFISEVDGICKVDKSMNGIIVTENGTTVSTTKSDNGNYIFFNVKSGATYKITGDSKTSNTHIKSIRLFPKDNLFHFANQQEVGIFSSVDEMNETLGAGDLITAESGVNAGDNVYRLFGYLEKTAVGDSDVFNNIDYVGWTFVKKSDVETFENSGAGVYDPNMTKFETQLTTTDGTDVTFAGIDPDNNKNLSGHDLYDNVYDYKVAPDAKGNYSVISNIGTNGPVLLRNIAASKGTEYYAYPYTVYKGSDVKAYSASTDDTPWRVTFTF